MINLRISKKNYYQIEHEAWETVARKMAHEIKNPLTPIQLTIDNLNSKYLPDLNEEKNINIKTI